MQDDIDFSLSEETFQKMLYLKEKMGYSNNNWNNWLNQVLSIYEFEKNERPPLEKIIEEENAKR